VSARAPIYLDHLATTPLDPRVLEAMLPTLQGTFGNPSSLHAHGRAARELVERARAACAAAIGASAAEEIVFTSGATEAANLALLGAARAYPSRRHVVCSTAEHRAVLDSCRELERTGLEVSWIDPDPLGRLRTDDVAAALRDDTLLVAAMWANNEVGSLNPIAELGELCNARGVLLFTDASQAVGKLRLDVEASRVDLLALSGHKLYGPKGVGALFVRRRAPRVRLAPRALGGGHERGLRSGTLNVPGIVGLGAACAIALAGLDDERRRLRALRDRLEERLLALEGAQRNGERDGLDGCLNVSFANVEAEDLLLALPELSISSGSACSSETREASHVLRAMGIGEGWIRGSLRFGLGRTTTEEEVDEAARLVLRAVESLRTSGATR